jgi:hypothetical protein
MKQIKTSSKNWLQELAKCYKDNEPVTLIDDANFGIDPIKESLVEMGIKGGLGFQDWVAVVISLGVAAAGAYLLVMAILDPEPFSKIAFALGTGAFLIMGGGFTAINVLTKKKPPKVKLSTSGFEMAWE